MAALQSMPVVVATASPTGQCADRPDAVVDARCVSVAVVIGRRGARLADLLQPCSCARLLSNLYGSGPARRSKAEQVRRASQKEMPFKMAISNPRCQFRNPLALICSAFESTEDGL